jgi:hypothetical protein
MALKSAGRHPPFPKIPALLTRAHPVKHRWSDLREKPLHKLIFSSDARNGPGVESVQPSA